MFFNVRHRPAAEFQGRHIGTPKASYDSQGQATQERRPSLSYAAPLALKTTTGPDFSCKSVSENSPVNRSARINQNEMFGHFGVGI
jgi:hypothetical protein